MTHLDIVKKVWSDWTVSEKLGEGSFGQVFRAKKERFGIIQEAAIKVVRIPSDDAELNRVKSGFGLNEQELKDYFYPQVEKLKKEIVLMQELGENNHIVRISDFDIIDDPDVSVGWYILIRMELLECLEDYIKNNDITVGDVINIGEDILTSLEVCEEKNIIHRDIKPGNLFRSDKGVYKLGDFGIARNVGTGGGSLSHKGTVNYMAPEVYLGKKYTGNIDIYALGIVLYKLLNKNRLPFMDEEKLTAGSVERAFQKRNTGEEFKRPKDASEDLFKIIKKMCAYDSRERFQSASKVKEALNEYKITHPEELKKAVIVFQKDTSVQGQNKEQERISVQESITYSNKNRSHISAGSDDKNHYATEGSKKPITGEGKGRQTNEFINKDEYKSSQRGSTRSIYDTGIQKQSSVQLRPVKEKTVIGKIEKKPKNRKNKIGLIIGIIFGVFMLIFAILFIIGSNVQDKEYVVTETSKTSKKKKKDSKTTSESETQISYDDETAESEDEKNSKNHSGRGDGESVARQIAADESIYDIDKDKYAEHIVEYTSDFIEYNKLSGVDGIYIGGLESGKPNGYGVFAYSIHITGTDFGETYLYFMYLGEWEDGNLKKGKNVEKRYRSLIENKNDTYYVLNDEWGIGDFNGDPQGKKIIKEFNSSTGDWEESMQAEGIFTHDTEFTYTLLNGSIYLSKEGVVFKGEFKEGDLYNGKAYDADGNEILNRVNGESQ